MSNTQNIRQAIIGGIYNASLPYPTKFPNLPMPTKDNDESWLRVNILYNKPTEIGLKELDNTTGVIQIDVFVKEGSGELNSIAIADEVRDILPKNQQGFEFGNVSVKVGTSGIESPFYSDGWYITPVTANFQVFTSRFD